MSKFFIGGCLFWGAGALFLYVMRPKSGLSGRTVRTMDIRGKILTAVVAWVVILLCTLPMSLSPAWNGEVPKHRDQYEVLAESMLNGHIYLDYDDIDPKLLEMENPYDPDLRKLQDVSFHWDHAFYNGHYYMYFGVVPVFLLFLPFRILTGVSLTTYHATQVFVALFIAGMFAYFLLLARKFFAGMSLSVYLSLSTAFSVMSVWYSAAAPALYCTAISSALCMEIWSLFFFSRAIWLPLSPRGRTINGVVGGLTGALAFGCRPPIALANLLLLPLLWHYVKGKKWDATLRRQILAAFLPYLVIGVLLMVYNAARFDNPFEFGQSYQLTVADQSQYGNLLSQFHWIPVINGLMESFLSFQPLTETFPYISLNSVLLNFPVCIFAYFCLAQPYVRDGLKKCRLSGFLLVLLILPFLITTSQVMLSPEILERYRSDVYWLMGILCFLVFGFCYQHRAGAARKRYGFFLSVLAYGILLKCFLLWTVPNDCNLTELTPEYLERIEAVLRFGTNLH